MAARFYHRLMFWRKLFTTSDVETIIAVVLNSTYDKEAVRRIMDDIDKFDAGEFDKQLQKHIYTMLGRLIKLDDIDDQLRLERWKKELNS